MSELSVAAGILIPGRGEPIRNGVVVCAGGQITYAGSAEDAPVRDDHYDFTVPVLMPGMWDVHTHLVGAVKGISMDSMLATPPATAGARSAADLLAALDAGVTSIRELGGHGAEIATAVVEGTIAGPAVYAAGSPISPSGGHADAHALPYQWVRDCATHPTVQCIADGVAECMRSVRLMLRRGAKVIKVCTSGGVISDIDHPMHQQFSDEELAAIVAEAARAQRVVAAHCHGREGVLAALRAGCRTIEHGSGLDDDCIEQLLVTGATLVPTRTIFEGILGMRQVIGERNFAKVRELVDMHSESMRKAIEAGVTIACGTDLGLSTRGSALSWGAHGAELGHLVAHGMTPLGAIETCTANAPATLGPQAPQSGMLAVGYDADFIALERDPLVNINVLADPASITHVWQSGALVKRLD